MSLDKRVQAEYCVVDMSMGDMIYTASNFVRL